MLGAAGIQTVERGYFFPEEESLPGLTFPIAAVFEDTPERIEPFEPGGNKLEGTMVVWLFVETGSVISDALGGGLAKYQKLDDLHDAILREMFNMFPVYFSQTTSVYAEAFEPWYWYRSKNLPIVAGELRLHYQMNFA